MKKLLIITPLALMMGLSSCVSNKKFAATKDKLQQTEQENANLMAANAELKTDNQVLSNKVYDLNSKLEITEDKLMALSAKQNDLEAEKDVLRSQMNENYKLLRDLQQRLADAMVEYPEEDVRVYFEDGELHLQLSNYLLFPSGSTDLKSDGEKALSTVADLLKHSEEMHIVVEGHTDNVPIGHSDRFEDNWDLSVLRATHIVRVLEKSGVDPHKITPAGRSKFEPVATNESAAGRSVNRRTEIIIQPDLTPLVEYWMGIGSALGVNH